MALSSCTQNVLFSGLFTFISWSSCFTSGDIIENTYHLWSSSKQQNMDSVIWSTRTRSAISCSAYCARDDNCVSAAYNKSDRLCTGYSKCNITKLLSTERLEWKRYCKDSISESPPLTLPKDCKDHLLAGNTTSGIYAVYTDTLGAFDVYCDMSTAGGGFTVFQYRFDGTLDFYRPWVEYKEGFGSLNHEFWLGNDKLHALTKNRDSLLYVELTGFDDSVSYATYDGFEVGGEETGYVLWTGAHVGTLGDAFHYDTQWEVNGMKFSTKDVDNDFRSYASCAQTFLGAWWYNDCMTSNLNGEYCGPSGTASRCNYWLIKQAKKKSKLMFRIID